MVWDIERGLWERGLLPGGVDEAGRGPFYGPVVAACVVMPPGFIIEGVTDSKKLPERKREALAARIWESALSVGVGAATVEEIGTMGVKKASRLAMERAIGFARPNYVLIDFERDLDVDMPQESFVKGDARSYLIAAASIVAKTYRDALMKRETALHPGYGLGAHKGYGTAAHERVILERGALSDHRDAFLRKLYARAGV